MLGADGAGHGDALRIAGRLEDGVAVGLVEHGRAAVGHPQGRDDEGPRAPVADVLVQAIPGDGARNDPIEGPGVQQRGAELLAVHEPRHQAPPAQQPQRIHPQVGGEAQIAPHPHEIARCQVAPVGVGRAERRIDGAHRRAREDLKGCRITRLSAQGLDDAGDDAHLVGAPGAAAREDEAGGGSHETSARRGPMIAGRRPDHNGRHRLIFGRALPIVIRCGTSPSQA
ncbi:MAG: hypothetical protein R3F60_15985 [bacterium]